MRGALGAVGLACLATLAAAPTDAFEWDLEYEADAIPQDAIESVQFHGSADAATLEDEALHLVNEAAHGGLFATYTVRDIGARNSRGVTVEARVKTVSAAGEHSLRPGIQLFTADSHCAEAVCVTPGSIETRYSLMRHAMDTTSDFHIYRLVAQGDDYRVYVDGHLAINGKGMYLGTRTIHHQLTWLDSVQFGAGSSYTQAEGYIDYVRYTTRGAFAPDGSPEQFAATPSAGEKIEVAPVGGIVSGMAAGLNDFDPSVPHLGGPVEAQVLHEDDTVQLWLQNATTKVFRRDIVTTARHDATIRLSLARNEHEPVQIVLRPRKAPLTNVRLEFSDLEAPQGHISRVNLSYGPLAYLNIPPDDVTSARGNRLGRPGYWPDGLLPYRQFDLKHEINYPVWVTVYCPPETPPGVYDGTIAVAADQVGAVELPLRVRVRFFSLPRTPRLNVQFLLNNVYNSAEKSMHVFKRMYREAAAHRGSPSRLFPGLKYEIRDGKVWVDPDNAKFVEMARYCIDELGVERFWFPHIGPHQMLGWFEQNRKDRTFMGVRMYEDEPPYTRFTPEFEARLIDYLSQASAFLRSKGLFEHFNCLTSRNEPACPPAWKPVKSFELEARYCDLVHQADPDLKVFMNMALVVGEPELDLIEDKVSIWAENTIGSRFELDDRVGFIPPRLIAERQAAGDEVLMYRNSHDYIDTSPDHSAVNHRVNGWIMWVTGTTGYYFDNGGIAADLWNANAWRKIGRDWNGETQWGAGSQLYPNANQSGVHSSIRFELNREGYEDYEYLATLAGLIEGRPDAARYRQALRELAEGIVPLYCWWRDGRDPDAFREEGVYEGAFTEDPRLLHETHERLGELIDELVME